MKQKLIILNLVSVFVVAFGLTTFSHEFAHALTAKMVGVESVLFHSYVSYDNSTTPSIYQIYILSSGPLISLLQASSFLILLRKRAKIDFISLLYLWMGIIGMVVFLGYIMMGPFIPYGDTGKVYAILSIPIFVSFSLTVLTLIAIIFFFRKLTPVIAKFLFFMKSETEFESNASFKFLFVLPISIGTAINILISLPAPTMMSLAFPMAIPLTMIPSAIRLHKSNLSSEKYSSKESGFSKRTYWSIIAMILIIVISRILAMGVNI